MIQNAIKYAMMKLKYIYINQQAGNRMPWVDIAKAIARECKINCVRL